MNGWKIAGLCAALVAILAAAPLAPAQEAEPNTAAATALADVTAQALEPGVRAALRGGQPVSFETQSDWGLSVRSLLEASLDQTFTDGHRRGSSRILLGDPSYEEDTAVVEVWFGRCEAHADTEILKVRMYAFTFRWRGEAWQPARSARLGTRQGACDGDWQGPGPVQT